MGKISQNGQNKLNAIKNSLNLSKINGFRELEVTPSGLLPETKFSVLMNLLIKTIYPALENPRRYLIQSNTIYNSPIDGIERYFIRF